MTIESQKPRLVQCHYITSSRILTRLIQHSVVDVSHAELILHAFISGLLTSLKRSIGRPVGLDTILSSL